MGNLDYQAVLEMQNRGIANASFPPGYIEGFRPTLKSNLTVSVGGGLTTVEGQDVRTGTVTIIRQMWNVPYTGGDAGWFYYVYLKKNGTYFVDSTPPAFSSRYFYWSHPAYGHRVILRLWMDSDEKIKYVSREFLDTPRKVTVAPDGYVGEADYYCDGVNDQIWINAALSYSDDVVLYAGSFTTTAAIVMSATDILNGSGRNTNIVGSTNPLIIKPANAKVDRLSMNGRYVDETATLFESPNTIDGGAPDTATFNYPFDGGAPDTLESEYYFTYGGMLASTASLLFEGDVFADQNTLHDPKILITDINGRIIELSRDVGLKITDGTYEERVIQIGVGQGIKATDNAGEIIHDIPDAPLQTDTRYLGHLVYIDSVASGNQIYESAAVPTATWTTVSTMDLQNTNSNGGLFQVFVSVVFTTTGLLTVYLRPKGSAWAPTTGAAVPYVHDEIGLSSGNPTIRKVTQSLTCPLGTSDQIEFYFKVNANTFARVNINQLGVFI